MLMYNNFYSQVFYNTGPYYICVYNIAAVLSAMVNVRIVCQWNFAERLDLCFLVWFDFIRNVLQPKKEMQEELKSIAHADYHLTPCIMSSCPMN